MPERRECTPRGRAGGSPRIQATAHQRARMRQRRAVVVPDELRSGYVAEIHDRSAPRARGTRGLPLQSAHSVSIAEALTLRDFTLRCQAASTRIPVEESGRARRLATGAARHGSPATDVQSKPSRYTRLAQASIFPQLRDCLPILCHAGVGWGNVSVGQASARLAPAPQDRCRKPGCRSKSSHLGSVGALNRRSIVGRSRASQRLRVRVAMTRATKKRRQSQNGTTVALAEGYHVAVDYFQ